MPGKDSQIDGTSQIDPSAEREGGLMVGAHTVIQNGVVIGRDVSIGSNVVIETGARIGDQTFIEHGAVIRSFTSVGCRVVVGVNSVLGQKPSRGKNSTLEIDTEIKPLTVGDECRIGVGAVLYAGTTIGPECFVADGAQIRENSRLSRGVTVGRGATVENECEIGENAKIQTGAYITALSVLEENVFIAPMVTTTNDNYIGRTQERFRHRKGVTVKRGGRVGGGAVLLPGVTVGQEALVAAGSIVTKDVPGYCVVMGVPARIVGEVPEMQRIYEKVQGVDSQ